jgi:hypothetical protein
MSVPTIHVTSTELNTERFWVEQLVPITQAAGLPEPTELLRDARDPEAHLLRSPTGELLAVVRTDRPPCPTCGR